MDERMTFCSKFCPKFCSNETKIFVAHEEPERYFNLHSPSGHNSEISIKTFIEQQMFCISPPLNVKNMLQSHVVEDIVQVIQYLHDVIYEPTIDNIISAIRLLNTSMTCIEIQINRIGFSYITTKQTQNKYLRLVRLSYEHILKEFDRIIKYQEGTYGSPTTHTNIG